MGDFLLRLLQVLIISIIKPFAEEFAKKLFKRFSKQGKGKPTLTPNKRNKGGDSD